MDNKVIIQIYCEECDKIYHEIYNKDEIPVVYRRTAASTRRLQVKLSPLRQ